MGWLFLWNNQMRSDAIKKGFDRAPARSMLRATGLGDEDFKKPFIGVTNTWSEITPVSYTHLTLPTTPYV